MEFEQDKSIYWNLIAKIAFAGLAVSSLVGIIFYFSDSTFFSVFGGFLTSILLIYKYGYFFRAIQYCFRIEDKLFIGIFCWLIILLLTDFVFLAHGLSELTTKTKTLNSLRLEDLKDAKYFEINNLKIDLNDSRIRTDHYNTKSGCVYIVCRSYALKDIPMSYYLQVEQQEVEGVTYDSLLEKTIVKEFTERSCKKQDNVHCTVEKVEYRTEEYNDFQRMFWKGTTFEPILMIKDVVDDHIYEGISLVAKSLLIQLIILVVIGLALYPERSRYYLEMAEQHRLDEIEE